MPSPTQEPPHTDQHTGHSWRDLWRLRHHVRPHRTRLIVTGVLGCVGIACLILIPLVIQRVIDGPLRHDDFRGAIGLCALGVVLGAVDAVGHFNVRLTQAKVSADIERSLRDELYQHLLRLETAQHERWQSGQLVTRLTEDVKAIRRFAGFGAVFFFVNTLMFLGVIALLVHLYWPLGLVVACGLTPLLVFANRFHRAYGPLARRAQDQEGEVASFAEESIAGITTTRALGRRDQANERFAERTERLRGAMIERASLLGRVLAEMSLVPNIVVVIVLCGGSIAVSRGDLTIGQLVAFTMLTVGYTWLLNVIGFIIATAREAATAAERLYEVFDAQPAITDAGHAEPLADATGRLTFENVAFRYPDAAAPLLRDVTLTVEPGETVALVGAPGSGKTTLTALVTRFHDVTGGRVLLDGHDVRDLPLADLRRLVACTFEDPTLFSASVRENVTLGRPEASDAEIDEALRVASAEFAHELPWGLDTRIGEQGMALSGGQRQRLALARAVLCRPRVLVLDDPLSALDVHTEAAVERALARVLAGTTALLVARRPSTVALADRVALLADGRIAALGTHTELLARSPAYREAMLTAAPARQEVT